MPPTEFLIKAGIWAAVMLTVAGVAVAMIARATRAHMRAQIASVMQATGLPRGGQGRPQLVTEGRATMRIPDGSYLVQLVRRIGNEDADPDEKPLSDLATALVANGIEPTNVVDARVSQREGYMTLSFLQRGAELSADVMRAALSLGFNEPARRNRQPCRPIDAQAMMGRKATERAAANVEVLRERLGMDRDLEIVSAEMATESPGDVDGVVVMAARVVWRQAERPAAPAATSPSPMRAAS